MGTHMKTTIELPEPLFQQAKRYAQAHRMTMKALIEQGLRKAMAQQGEAEPFKLRDGSVGGNGLSREFQGASWDKLRELMYDPTEGRG